MKRILVTGGNGQLGSELKALSGDYSFDFTFIDVNELDLLNSQAISDFFKKNTFDFIINCAAYTAVDKAEEEKDICRKINTDAVASIATMAKQYRSRLIHISTDYIFDGEFNQPIDEHAIANPLSVYGKTKFEGEEHVRRILSDAYIVRTSWVYSTHGKNFVKTIAGLAKQRSELTVVSDQYGTPTYAKDLAVAIMSIVTSSVDQPGIYNYTNEGSISWFDFAVAINDHFGYNCKIKPIKTFEYKTAAVRPKFSVLDKTKIRKTFDIDIPYWSHSLKECLNKLVL